MGGQFRGIFSVEIGDRLGNQILEAANGELEPELAAKDGQAVAVECGKNGGGQRNQTEQDNGKDNLANLALRDQLIDHPLHEDGGNQGNQLNGQKDDCREGGVSPKARQRLDDLTAHLPFSRYCVHGKTSQNRKGILHFKRKK